jgi:small subunit ribosomal protein S6
MRRYELLWILAGDASDKDCEASADRAKALIVRNGGELHSAGLWGRRNLSYPINKQAEGTYYVATFSVEPEGAIQIDGQMTADQAVQRHLLVRAEEVESKETKETAEAKAE